LIEVHPGIVRHGHLAAAATDSLVFADEEKRQRRNRGESDERQNNAQSPFQITNDFWLSSDGLIHPARIVAHKPSSAKNRNQSRERLVIIDRQSIRDHLMRFIGFGFIPDKRRRDPKAPSERFF
jgi:hypothetical protein